MTRRSLEDQPAHWVLVEMGKRVLRPGGKALTTALVDALGIGPNADVVEFAPGTGFTARLALERSPRSYTGVELDRDAANALAEEIAGPNREVIVGNAADTDLESASADVVYGEAMLTMQPADAKREIVGEASRLLRADGRYGIHELGLVPDELDERTKAEIREDLSEVTRVNARPLTESEWLEVLESEGFEVTWIGRAPMALLSPRRVVDDEGVARALKIGFNVLTTPPARRRIRSMRSVFDRYDEHLNAVAAVAEKR